MVVTGSYPFDFGLLARGSHIYIEIDGWSDDTEPEIIRAFVHQYRDALESENDQVWVVVSKVPRGVNQTIRNIQRVRVISIDELDAALDAAIEVPSNTI